MEAKFSIRYKFLAVVTFLIALCVGTYLMLATYVFQEDKRELVYDYNRSLVTQIGAELDSSFRAISDQMRLAAYFHRERKKDQLVIQDILRKNPDVVFVGLSDRFQKLNRTLYLNEEYVETYGSSEEFFLGILPEARPIPFEELQTKGEVFWSASLAGSPPLVGMGKTVIEENSQGVPVDHFALVAFIQPNRMMESLKENATADVKVLSEYGQVLVSADANSLSHQATFASPIFTRALASKLNTEVTRVESSAGPILGAYTKLRKGAVYVVSSVNEGDAFLAVSQLVRRSVLFGTILLTLAFIMAVFFSRSLTKPIEVLVGGMKKVSEGDLETKIHVRSQDEIAVLANNFNRMIHDLHTHQVERDGHASKLEEMNRKVHESERLTSVAAVARGVAHEFGNLLMQIVGKAEISRNKNEAEMREALDKIINASQVAGEILDRFHNLSDHQVAQQKKQDEDILALVKGAYDLLSHQFRKYDIEFIYEKQDSATAYVCGTALLQVFVNLFINAIHAIGKKGGKIYAGVEARGGNVLVTIRDSGPGVPEGELAKISEAFYTTKGSEGTGLGLAICKEVIEIDHQGEFKLSNHPEGGFQIQLLVPMKSIAEVA